MKGFRFIGIASVKAGGLKILGLYGRMEMTTDIYKLQVAINFLDDLSNQMKDIVKPKIRYKIRMLRELLIDIIKYI